MVVHVVFEYPCFPLVLLRARFDKDSDGSCWEVVSGGLEEQAGESFESYPMPSSLAGQRVLQDLQNLVWFFSRALFLMSTPQGIQPPSSTPLSYEDRCRKNLQLSYAGAGPVACFEKRSPRPPEGLLHHVSRSTENDGYRGLTPSVTRGENPGVQTTRRPNPEHPKKTPAQTAKAGLLFIVVVVFEQPMEM